MSEIHCDTSIKTNNDKLRFDNNIFPRSLVNISSQLNYCACGLIGHYPECTWLSFSSKCLISGCHVAGILLFLVYVADV